MRIPLAALAAWLATSTSSFAEPGERCLAPEEAVGDILPPAEASELLSERELRIVCLGSSSTQGVGATSAAAAYPARLDAILEQRLPGRTVDLLDGIRRIERQGAEVVLMDPQPLPAPEKERAITAMSDAISKVARETRTPLFPRHALMRERLRAGGFTPSSLYAGDGLHMTDAGYRCLAEDLADALVPGTVPGVR